MMIIGTSRNTPPRDGDNNPRKPIHEPRDFCIESVEPNPAHPSRAIPLIRSMFGRKKPLQNAAHLVQSRGRGGERDVIEVIPRLDLHTWDHGPTLIGRCIVSCARESRQIVDVAHRFAVVP